MERLTNYQLSALEPENLMHVWQASLPVVASRFLGKGETPGRNNQGPDVDFFRENDGVPDSDLHQARTGGSGAWCATATSAVCTIAARELNIELPFKTSRGSKMLCQRARDAGAYVVCEGSGKERVDFNDDFYTIPIGSLVAWDTGSMHAPVDWTGHSALAVSYDPVTDTLETYEGNKNNFYYRGRKYARYGKFTYASGVWRHRIDLIVSFIPPERR